MQWAARPWGLSLDSAVKHLFTANGSSNDMSVIDVAKGKVESRVKVDGLPWGVVTGAH